MHITLVRQHVVNHSVVFSPVNCRRVREGDGKLLTFLRHQPFFVVGFLLCVWGDGTKNWFGSNSTRSTARNLAVDRTDAESRMRLRALRRPAMWSRVEDDDDGGGGAVSQPVCAWWWLLAVFLSSASAATAQLVL